MAPQATYCSCSGVVRHRQCRRTADAAAQARAHGLWPAAMQPHVALVCRIDGFHSRK